MFYSLLSCLFFSLSLCLWFFFFFFNDTATTEIYTLSLHDALPISSGDRGVRRGRRGRSRVGRADLRRGRAARRGRADARRAAGVGQGTARALQDSARPPLGAHPAAERPGKGDEAPGRAAPHRLRVQDLSRVRQSSCDVPGGPACSASQGNVPDPRSPAAS